MNIKKINITALQFSAILVILTFLGTIIYNSYTGRNIVLSDMVVAMVAAGMVPLALELTLYPFFPSWGDSIKKKGLQITIMGLILLFIFLTTIYEKVGGS